MPPRRRSGFTLVELLVVVSVLAILAAVALPNFLESQTRSKVARVQADLRTVALALESYHADFNRYPPSTLVPRFARFIPLTTPIAYLSSIPRDVFQTIDENAGRFRRRGNYAYGAMPIDVESRYAMASDGPDLDADHGNIQFYPGYSPALFENPASGFDFVRYDPTNGTISNGDIFRLSDFIVE